MKSMYTYLNGNVSVKASERMDSACCVETMHQEGEVYAVFRLSVTGSETFEEQMEMLFIAKKRFLETVGEGGSIVFERYFLSDIANQIGIAERYRDTVAATSFIGQEPMDGSKVALLLCMQKGGKVWREGEFTIAESHGCRHYWLTGLSAKGADSYEETQTLLHRYEEQLKRSGMSIAGNCLRTWFFVKDVDSNYAGLVRGRREYFEEIELTPDTHFIASTGINGTPRNTASRVHLDALAVEGVKESQIAYLHAPSHLNPTHEYNVTFERGTKVSYEDCCHLWISGTASIDNKGEILHEGCVLKQTERMLENVEALLQAGGAGFSDVAYMIVYLRDIADYRMVNEYLEERFPETPKVVVHAPVCRPGWLIEMECLAVRDER